MFVTPDEWLPLDIPSLEETAWKVLRSGTASVNAGPGSGKTELLAQRAGYLFQTGSCKPPQRILAISFKRAAARNLKKRAEARLPEYAARLDSMTFDAFAKSIVDRFRALLPPEWVLERYDLNFASRKDIQAFLYDISVSKPEIGAKALEIPVDTFLTNVLGTHQLNERPSLEGSARTVEERVVGEWWNRFYLGADTKVLDFTMINRLADLIVRTNPQLLTALRATYPFVFMDEFQDTTYAQYSFLRSVFTPESTKVTVVGDRKQRIMGWAGAMSDAFEDFTTDFQAEEYSLATNFRSPPNLVDLQHRFAKRIDPDSNLQVARKEHRVDIEPVEFWSFPTAEMEAETIAGRIAREVGESDLLPSDYALLARQKVSELQPVLEGALHRVNLKLRNDDAQVGEIKLHDLLADDLVELFMDIVKLAVKKGGQPKVWRGVTTKLSYLRSGHSSARVQVEVEEVLSIYLNELRTWMRCHDLASHRESKMEHVLASELTDSLKDFVKPERLKRRRSFGDSADDLGLLLDAFQERVEQALEDLESWRNLPDVFYGIDAVALSSIHQSKGLEYHTVFMVGLDDEQWWSHTRNPGESTMTFFVGVSRAAERLIFTQCDERGSAAPLGDLYQDLKEAGVELQRFG